MGLAGQVSDNTLVAYINIILIIRSSAPAATQTISSNPISFLASLPDRSRNRHQMLAVGDDCGTLYVMEVPRSLSKPIKNEASLMYCIM